MRRIALALLLAVILFPAVVSAQSDPVVRGGTAVYPGIDVNIGDASRLRRLHLAFEAQCQDAAGAEAAITPQVREAVLLFLRDRTVAELTAPRGKERLREQLIAVMNRTIGAPRVIRLFYLQFIII